MKILDLGTIESDSPLLIFGGPYSNLEATQALLSEAKKRNIPSTRIICTGDIAAYCADPRKTSEVLKESGVYAIQGNCEQSLMNQEDDCNCGFDGDSACSIIAKQWFNHCQKEMTNDIRDWYRSLPDYISFSYGGKKFTVVHGSFTNINEFIFSSDSEETKLKQIEASNSDAIICGHNGIPSTQIWGDKCWHNAGAIGMPANDGTPRGWYSLIKSNTQGTISFEHHALDYDHQTAQKKVIENNLPRGYADCLETGLWPSIDILPDAEKNLTGKALDPQTINWSV